MCFKLVFDFDMPEPMDMQPPSKAPIKLLDLPNELLEKIAELTLDKAKPTLCTKCCRAWSGCEYPWCQYPLQHISGRRHLFNFSATCRTLRDVGKGVLFKHLRVRDGFGETDWVRPGEMPPGYEMYEEYPGPQGSDHISHVIQQIRGERAADYNTAAWYLKDIGDPEMGLSTSLLTKVQSFRFDLPERAPVEVYPVVELAAMLVKFLPKLTGLRTFVFAVPVGESGSDVFGNAFKIFDSLPDDEKLKSVTNLAIGKDCHFVMKACPNVRTITTHGGSPDILPPFLTAEPYDPLLRQAGELKHLEHIEIESQMSHDLLRAMSAHDNIRSCHTLGFTHRNLWIPNRLVEDGYIPIQDFEMLELLENFETVRTLIVPSSAAFDFFELYGEYVDAPPLPIERTGLEVIIIEPSNPETDEEPWVDYHNDRHLQVEPSTWSEEDDLVHLKYDLAYTKLVEHICAYMPWLKTIWVDCGVCNELSYGLYGTKLRDVRLQVENGKLQGIKRGEMRARITDSDVVFPSYWMQKTWEEAAKV